VQKILGHLSILTTLRYTHLTQQRQLASQARINELIGQIHIRWGKVT